MNLPSVHDFLLHQYGLRLESQMCRYVEKYLQSAARRAFAVRRVIALRELNHWALKTTGA